MVMFINIRVKTYGTCANINETQLAHRSQIGQSLVHSAQRDARHLGTGLGIESFSGGVHGVAVHEAEQQLPLRRDLQASRTKGFGELGR